MDLDRGVLARLDRKLLAGLGQNETYRMVRVPATAAKWSTWKRYCDSAGISMGRAIVALIDRELVSVFRDPPGDHAAVFAEQAEEELAKRQEQVARREEKAAEAEQRLRAWSEQLRMREGELETRGRRVEFAAKMAARSRGRRSGSGGANGVHADRASSTSTAMGCQADDHDGCRIMDAGADCRIEGAGVCAIWRVTVSVMRC